MKQIPDWPRKPERCEGSSGKRSGQEYSLAARQHPDSILGIIAYRVLFPHSRRFRHFYGCGGATWRAQSRQMILLETRTQRGKDKSCDDLI